MSFLFWCLRKKLSSDLTVGSWHFTVAEWYLYATKVISSKNMLFSSPYYLGYPERFNHFTALIKSLCRFISMYKHFWEFSFCSLGALLLNSLAKLMAKTSLSLCCHRSIINHQWNHHISQHTCHFMQIVLELQKISCILNEHRHIKAYRSFQKHFFKEDLWWGPWTS